MGTCCGKLCHWCNCCKESDEFELSSGQYVTTVRRISSVGHTIINDDGEEREIPRHSSILHSYNGVTLPWTSTTTSIQPGVTRKDILERVKALPVIIEHTSPNRPPKSKNKMKKKTGDKLQDLAGMELLPVQLHRYTKKEGELSVSHDDLRNRRVDHVLPFPGVDLRRGSCGSSPSLTNANEKNDKKKDETLCDSSTSWSQSQSLENINRQQQQNELSEAAKMAKRYGLDLSLYTCLDPSGDPSSHIQNYPVFHRDPLNLWSDKHLGTISVTSSLDVLQKLLCLTVNSLSGLTGPGLEKRSYLVQIKLTLDKEKKGAKIGKKALHNSSYTTTLEQNFSIFTKDVNSTFVRISIYNASFTGRHDALGHALFPLKEAKYERKSSSIKIYRTLNNEASPSMMEVDIQYLENLFITVKRIFNILPKFSNSKMYVKVIHYSLSKKTKEKTLQPIFASESQLIFEQTVKLKADGSGSKHNYVILALKTAATSSSTLDVSLLKKTRDKTIARVYLGPSFRHEDQTLTVWGQAFAGGGQQLNYTFKMYP